MSDEASEMTADLDGTENDATIEPLTDDDLEHVAGGWDGTTPPPPPPNGGG